MTEMLAKAKPQPRIDHPEELDRVLHRLVQAFDPVAVCLFGSRARGDAGEDSDYDLMLVLADDNERVRSRQDVWQTARSRRILVNTYHIQQAAEKLTEAVLVAVQKRPRKGHQIGEFAKRLPTSFPDRGRFPALDRFSDYVRAHPEDDLSRQPPPVPSVSEARAWIGEVEGLKADFERWLAQREAQP